MKLISRLEKNISDNKESLRAEMRSNQAELKNGINEMQSKLDTARVKEAGEQISETEDNRKEGNRGGMGKTAYSPRAQTEREK